VVEGVSGEGGGGEDPECLHIHGSHPPQSTPVASPIGTASHSLKRYCVLWYAVKAML